MLSRVHGCLPFDQKFRGEFPEISMGKWYSLFPVWKTIIFLFGIFQWLLGLKHKYRSKQNTDKSTSWLFIDHNNRDHAQTTTAAKTPQKKGFNNESCNGSARVINLCTFPSQPKQNKHVHHGGIIFIKRFLHEFVASIYRHISRKVLKCFLYIMRVILAWDVQLAVIAAKRTS